MSRLLNANTTNFLLFEVSEADVSAEASEASEEYLLSDVFQAGFQQLTKSAKQADKLFTQTMPDLSDPLQRREFLSSPYVRDYIPEDISRYSFDSEESANRALDYFYAQARLETQQAISDKQDIRLIQVIRMLMQVGNSDDGAGNYVLINLISAFLESIVVSAAVFSEKMDLINQKNTTTGMSLKVEGENIVLSVASSVLFADLEMLTVNAEIEIAPSGHFKLRPLKFYVPADLEDDLLEAREMILSLFEGFGKPASEVVPLAIPEAAVSQDSSPFMATVKEKFSNVNAAIATLGRDGLCAPIVVDKAQALQIKALCEAVCDADWLAGQKAKIKGFANPTIHEGEMLLGALKQHLVDTLHLVEKDCEPILNALLRCLLQKTFSDAGDSPAASNISLPYEIGGIISNGFQGVLAEKYNGPVYLERSMQSAGMYSVENTSIQLNPCADGVKIVLTNNIVTPKPGTESESTVLGVCSQEWVLNTQTFAVNPGQEPLSLSITPPGVGDVSEDYDPNVLRENVLEPIKAEKRQLFGKPPSASLAKQALEVAGASSSSPTASPKKRGILGWFGRNKRKVGLIAFSAVALVTSCVLIATGVGSPIGLLLSAMGLKAAAAAITATTAITYGASVAIAAVPAVVATVAAGVESVKASRRTVEPGLKDVAASPAHSVVESVIESPAHSVVESVIESPVNSVVESVIEIPAHSVVEPVIESPAHSVVEPAIESPANSVVESVIESPVKSPSATASMLLSLGCSEAPLPAAVPKENVGNRANTFYTPERVDSSYIETDVIEVGGVAPGRYF